MFLLSVIQRITSDTCGCFFIVLLIYNLVILSSDLLVFYMIIYYIYFDLKNNQIWPQNSILFQKKKNGGNDRKFIQS